MGYALGLKLMEDCVVCAVTNFEARVLHYQDQPLATEGQPELVSDALAQIVRSVMTTSGLKPEKFFGVGVGLAGVIHGSAGRVHFSPFFGWRDVPLAAMLQARTGLPVTIENDVHTLAQPRPHPLEHPGTQRRSARRAYLPPIGSPAPAPDALYLARSTAQRRHR